MKFKMQVQFILSLSLFSGLSSFAQAKSTEAPKRPMKAIACSLHMACGIGKNDNRAYCFNYHEGSGRLFRSHVQNVETIAVSYGWSSRAVTVLAGGFKRPFSPHDSGEPIAADSLYDAGTWASAAAKNGKVVWLNSYMSLCPRGVGCASASYEDDSFRITRSPKPRTLYHSDLEYAQKLAVSETNLCGLMKGGRVYCENLDTGDIEDLTDPKIKDIVAGNDKVVYYTDSSIYLIDYNTKIKLLIENFHGIQKVVINQKGQVVALKDGLMYLIDRFQNQSLQPVSKIKVTDISVGNWTSVCALEENGRAINIDPLTGKVRILDFDVETVNY